MKIAICLAVMLCFAAAQGPAIGPTAKSAPRANLGCAVPETDSALRGVAEKWKQNYNQGNAVGVAALYAPDAIYLTQHFATGIVEGRAAIQAYVQRGVDAKYHVDTIEVLRTDCAGEMGYAIDRYTATNNGQQAIGVNLVVLRRINGHWRIVAHEAAVPDPATAIHELDIRKN